MFNKNLFTTLMLLGLSLNASALDIDEKLTLRFLKVSNTKKTVLINRGAEDGLVVGDHAKFFITSGIVARGVVEKVSPSRSIWSLYRIVAPEEITDNKVLNLKIASPVKITNDPTKSMADENTIEGQDKLTIPKSDAVVPEDHSADKLNDEDKKELDEMGLKEKEIEKASNKSAKAKEAKNNSEVEIEKLPMPASNISKTWDLYGSLALNALTGTEEGATGSNSTSVSSSMFDLTLGLEKYLFNTETFKNVSAFAILNIKSMENGDSAKTTSNWLLYGGGLNYHFYNLPQSYNRLIGYATASFGMGTISVKEKTVVGNTATETPYEGTSNFFSLGIGAKYILSQDFGARAILDYYSSSESFNYDDGSTSTRSLSGPRVQFGISYRF